jgi:N-acetylmuramoyl-L-alanine amidase
MWAMMSVFAGKKESKLRQDMLRGVYEENRRILGKGNPAPARRKPSHLRKIFLLITVCLLTVLIQGTYTGTSFSPAEISTSGDTPPPEMAVNMAMGLPSLSTPGLYPEDAVNTLELSAFEKSRNVPFSRMLGLKIKTIMIDAGHGGTDSGTRGIMGTLEKDITLDIAKRLKALLVQRGLPRVFMTREDDTFVPLQTRVAVSRKSKADLFISIHLNYLPRKPINAIETYYFGPSDDKRTLKLAEQENTGSEYGLSDFREIMEKLGKTMKLQESKEFAKSIQANLFQNSRKESEDVQDLGVKRAPFVVLLGVDVPAVLAEVSCLSNREEEQELNSESHRENIATYLASGVFDYLYKGALTHVSKR